MRGSMNGPGIGVRRGFGPDAPSSETPFSPIDQSPERWYRGDLGVTLVSDAVSAWADQSGNAKHWAQSTAVNRPTMGTLGGQSAIVFTDTSALVGPVVSGLTAAHAFIIFVNDADPPSGANVFGHFGSDASEDHLPLSDGSIYMGIGSTVRKNTGNPTPSLASNRLYEVISTASEYTTRIDGTQNYTTATNTVGWDATNTRLGRTTLGFKGKIAELILYPTKRDASQLAALYAYFESRYGVTLP